MSELKPCPLCGDDAAFVERTDLSSCAVICDHCGARGPASCPEDDEDLRLEEKNDWEPGEAAARRLWNRRSLPEGMAVVPREITAESGHKAGMIGDFIETIEDCCPECGGSGWDDGEDCDVCEGHGGWYRKVAVEWTTIKAIHRRVIEIAEEVPS